MRKDDKSLAIRKIELSDEDQLPATLLKRAEELAEFCAIYIVTPRKKLWPVSFGTTTNPQATYYSYQKGWWDEHILHTVAWTPGKPAAERVKKKMAETIAKHRRFFARNWFDVTAEEAVAVLKNAAMHERVQLFDEVERQRKYHIAVRDALENAAGIERQEASKEGKVIALKPRRR